MFGKNAQLTPLASRKQLLLMESELNRVQWFEAWHGLKSELLQFKNQARDLGTTVVAGARLAAELLARGSDFLHHQETRKHSWVTSMFRGFQAGTTLWRRFSR